MAWLTPQTLTCSCGFDGEITWLHQKPPGKPKQRRLFKLGPFRREGDALFCPTCGATVKEIA